MLDYVTGSLTPGKQSNAVTSLEKTHIRLSSYVVFDMGTIHRSTVKEGPREPDLFNLCTLFGI